MPADPVDGLPGSSRLFANSLGSRKRMREHLRRAVRKDIDATGTVQLLRVLDKAEAALDGKFESDAAYEAQERRVRQLVARATDKLVVGSVRCV